MEHLNLEIVLVFVADLNESMFRDGEHVLFLAGDSIFCY